MNGTHEPRESFVRALEARVSSDIGRRAASPRLPGWVPQSRGRLILATAALVLVSMAAGGGAVVLAYQAQTAEARQMLDTSYKQRAALAREQQAIALKLFKEIQQRVSVGAASTVDLLDGRMKLAAADAELQSVELQVEEVHQTGHEPVTQVSAPLVNGRDFVSERWRIEMSVPEAALQAEQSRLTGFQTRVSAGMANASDLEPIRARVKELEASISSYQRKLDIRQKFLNKSLDAALADLRVLEVDTDQRVAMLTGKIDDSRKEVERAKARVAVGMSPALEVAEAEMRLHQMEFELSKAQYDLALIRRQINLRGR